MRIARPIALIFVIALALALPHGPSHVVFAQTECVQPLASVAVEGSWNSDCLSESRDNAYARYYTFTLTQEVEVTIILESEIDSYLFLLKESGEITAENDDIDRNNLSYKFARHQYDPLLFQHHRYARPRRPTPLRPPHSMSSLPASLHLP